MRKRVVISAFCRRCTRARHSRLPSRNTCSRHARQRIHVDRIAAAIRAARANGREVVIAGRAMRNTIEAARACGMLKDSGRLLDEEEFGYLPPDKVMLLCTGSQGEPRAAIARIAEAVSYTHLTLPTTYYV